MESLFGQKRLMFFISQSTQSTTLRDCWSSLGVDLLLLRPENPIWGRKWSVEKSSDGNPRRKERSVKRAYHICNCELWTDHVEPRGCEEDLSLSLSLSLLFLDSLSFHATSNDSGWCTKLWERKRLKLKWEDERHKMHLELNPKSLHQPLLN